VTERAKANRPWFLWDVDVSEEELRERLRQPNDDMRAQWQACVMREARYREVWQYLSLAEILRDWPNIQRHLGRSRAFWEFLLRGWREDGLLAS
jgi:hypothetical protein